MGLLRREACGNTREAAHELLVGLLTALLGALEFLRGGAELALRWRSALRFGGEGAWRGQRRSILGSWRGWR